MSDRDAIVKAAFEVGQREADAHYAAMYQAYLDAVPEYLRPAGDAAPSATRKSAIEFGYFNSETSGYALPLDLGPGHVPLSAMFAFRSDSFENPSWKFDGYVCMIRFSMGMHPDMRCVAKTLPAAILAAREMWLDVERLNSGLTDLVMPSGMGAPQRVQ